MTGWNATVSGRASPRQNRSDPVVANNTLDPTAAFTGEQPGSLPAAGLVAAAIAFAAVYLNAAISLRQAALFLVGAFAGVVLYHAAFGFTSDPRA